MTKYRKIQKKEISVDKVQRENKRIKNILCGGEIFRPYRPWDPLSLIPSGYRVSFPGVKRRERDVSHPSFLAPRLKKKYNYNSTPSLGLRDLFQGELYLLQ